MNATARRLVRLLSAAAIAALAAAVLPVVAAPEPAAAQDAPRPSGKRPRVLVLGFDGLAADRVEALIAARKLPNFERLRDHGGYARMRPSNPAQSPVSWASITTGWNPGKTGIYDFLRRQNLDGRRITFANAEK